jgi:hypothetical protein
MNPGSPTFPRTSSGPTIGRVLVSKTGEVVHTEIVKLRGEDEDNSGGWSFARLFHW